MTFTIRAETDPRYKTITCDGCGDEKTTQFESVRDTFKRAHECVNAATIVRLRGAR